MSSADVKKSVAGITLSTTSLLLTLFCFEVKIRHQWLEAVSRRYTGKHSAEHHRQGRWSVDSMTACMLEGEGASFWTSAVNSRFFSEPPDHKKKLFRASSILPHAKHVKCNAFSSVDCGWLRATHSLPKKTRCILRVYCVVVCKVV